MKLPAWKVGRSRVRTPLWQSSFKKTKCFFLANSQIFDIVESLCDREVACAASDRQGSNSVSRGWCHLHVYMCTKCTCVQRTTFISFFLFEKFPIDKEACKLHTKISSQPLIFRIWCKDPERKGLTPNGLVTASLLSFKQGSSNYTRISNTFKIRVRFTPLKVADAGSQFQVSII